MSVAGDPGPSRAKGVTVDSDDAAGSGDSGKVAVITGATGGIGSVLVDAYRALGYRVVATARSVPESDDPGMVAVSADLSDPRSGGVVIGAALDTFGRVDTLVNSAGVYLGRPFTDYTDDDFELMMEVNLRGFFTITRAAVSVMLQGRGGHIVNISTSLVDRPDPSVPAGLASLTKGGLEAVTRELAAEYAARGIRVNAVALGVVRSRMNPQVRPELVARHPLGRMVEVADVVQGIMYLEHASLVTGEIHHIDGGQNVGRG